MAVEERSEVREAMLSAFGGVVFVVNACGAGGCGKKGVGGLLRLFKL